MKYASIIIALATCFLVCSCSSLQSGGSGITGTEINTYTESINRYDLDVDTDAITYTIDVSTVEGRLKLKGLSLVQAQQLVTEEAAIKNNCARIISPKYSYLKKGKQIFRVTVFGFPARYKNSQNTATPDRPQPGNHIIIVK